MSKWSSMAVSRTGYSDRFHYMDLQIILHNLMESVDIQICILIELTYVILEPIKFTHVIVRGIIIDFIKLLNKDSGGKLALMYFIN